MVSSSRPGKETRTVLLLPTRRRASAKSCGSRTSGCASCSSFSRRGARMLPSDGVTETRNLNARTPGKSFSAEAPHASHGVLAKLPTTFADPQVARWQSTYGRDPTDQQRSWLLSKIRTDMAMMGTTSTKLNARSSSRTSSHFRPRERERGWNLSIRTGPACKAGDHTQADTKVYHLVGWRMWQSLGTANGPLVDST
jgi:hypothetical protein